METASRVQSIRILRRTSSLTQIHGTSPMSDPLMNHRLTLSPDVVSRETKLKEAPVFAKISFKKNAADDTEEAKKKKKLEKSLKKKAKKELKKRQELLRQQMLRYEQKYSLMRNLPDAEKVYLDFRPNGGRHPESSYAVDMRNFFLSQRQAQESGTTEHCTCIRLSDMQIVMYVNNTKSPSIPNLSTNTSTANSMAPTSSFNKNLSVANVPSGRERSVLYSHTSLIQTHFPAIFEVLELKSKQVSVSPKTDTSIRKVKYRLDLEYDSEIDDVWRMIEYIYSGEIDPAWNHQTLYRILKIAEKFQHYQLSRLCDELITSQGQQEEKGRSTNESAWSLLRQGPPEAILYDTDIFSDVKFVHKQSHELICNAHKVILSARNLYFRQLFSSDQSNSDEVEVELIEGVSSLPSFKFLIRYLYTDKYEGIENVVIELYYLALFYQVSRLIILCELAMIEGIDEDNVVDLLVWSEANGIENVLKATEWYCIYHIEWVKNSEGWRERLPEDKKQKLLYKHSTLKF